MDGSAKDFVECLIKAGINIQNEERKVLEITRAVNHLIDLESPLW